MVSTLLTKQAVKDNLQRRASWLETKEAAAQKPVLFHIYGRNA